MRALFVGGTVDNSELDLEGETPPLRWPPDSAGRDPRYRLHQVGQRDGSAVFAVYAAPEMAGAEVDRVIEERAYARRFEAQPVQPR
ncbi:hypothetical protein WCE55_10965 [Luteimonas sp. MJ293]|uniref:hypothetical protein n=1 Tax=Luteimonas sp. MJ146 TaxID=3129240 RepID=UPI0031BA687E